MKVKVIRTDICEEKSSNRFWQVRQAHHFLFLFCEAPSELSKTNTQPVRDCRTENRLKKEKKKKEKKLILGEESENKRLTPKHIEKCNNHDELH